MGVVKMIRGRFCIVCGRLFGFETPRGVGAFMNKLDLSSSQEWRNCIDGKGHELNKLPQHFN